MSGSRWDFPRTEEGLKETLDRLAQCREVGDRVGVGNGLLHLAYLVVWVRSDNGTAPFERSAELNLEALGEFRAANHEPGLVRALIAVSGRSDPETRAQMLTEAEELAAKLGDQNLVAATIAAQARSIVLTDRSRAEKLHLDALEIYRKTGNLGGQARTLFSLSIGEGDRSGYALEAAEINRQLGDFAEAGRCCSVALMNAEGSQSNADLTDIARRGLDDSQKGGDRTTERHFYEKLALFSAADGQVEEAERYRRWAAELRESEGLTPLERWVADIAMTKQVIAMSKKQGNKEALRMFQAELRRLKASKPE